MTLPGFEHISDPAPGKTASGYLTWLLENEWPEGWQFWALAGSACRAERSTEWVYLIRRHELREALVCLRTGRVLKWGELT